MAYLLLALLLAGCLGIRALDKRCERSYLVEVEYWQRFQAQVEEEHVQMGQRWALADLQAIARGEPPQGCPRGTPALTLAVYRDLVGEAEPIAIRLPKWEHETV